MGSKLMPVLVRLFAGLHREERGEVNASMIAWMVVATLVIFAFRTQLTSMLTAAATFVMNTLGI